MTTKYLDEESISTPAVALDLARAEVARMAKLVWRMLASIIIPFMSDEKLIEKEVSDPEEKEFLLREIPTKRCLADRPDAPPGNRHARRKNRFYRRKNQGISLQIDGPGRSPEQANEAFGMISIASDMESMADLIHRNMVPLIAKKKDLMIDFSEEGKEEILIYHQKVCRRIELLKEVFYGNGSRYGQGNHVQRADVSGSGRAVPRQASRTHPPETSWHPPKPMRSTWN